MNQVIEVGRMTRDPELHNEGEHPYVKFTIAVDRYVKDGDDKTDFIPCVAFGKNAGTIHDCFYKGRSITISGRLTSSSYEDKNGNKRSSLNVTVDRWEFPQNDPQNKHGNSEQKPSTAEQPQDSFEDVDEDVPF